MFPTFRLQVKTHKSLSVSFASRPLVGPSSWGTTTASVLLAAFGNTLLALDAHLDPMKTPLRDSFDLATRLRTKAFNYKATITTYNFRPQCKGGAGAQRPWGGRAPARRRGARGGEGSGGWAGPSRPGGQRRRSYAPVLGDEHLAARRYPGRDSRRARAREGSVCPLWHARQQRLMP